MGSRGMINQMVKFRLGRGPATITELARPFGISLPGPMKHVRILEQAERNKGGPT
jgi:hypothetical protein